jgi:tetratricopeptide (TPR) repeat protein
LHLARILWRLEQREEAIAQLRRTIKNEPRHEPAWTVLREWAGVMEKPELPMQVVLEITEERPGDPQGWLVFAEMLAAEGNVQGALDHVARAIRLQPRLVEAYDLKVRLLVSLKQKQEAIETCYAKAWEGRVPVQLCGRAAWVEAELGSLPAAVKSLNEALADHPDHYRGWQMLADWTLRLGDVDGAMHAVARMALLAPRSPVPLGLRARLKLQRQDRAGAKADLQQALKLDLAYEQGAAMLFDLLLEDQDLGAATDLLALIKRHVVGPLAATCEARLNAERARESAPVTAVPTEARSPESQAALKAFRVLCLSNLEGTGPLDGAFRALLRGPSGAQADALLEELLQSPNASPFVGAFWARRRVVWKGFGLRDELNALLKRGEIGRKAIVTYIGELAAHSLADPLHHLIEEHKTWLVRDQEGWEAVGVALRTLRLDNEFFEWMRDWRERTDFGPELRLGLVCALRNQGRDQEADEVARTASSSVSANPASHCLQVWVAVEAAIAGESERGQRALQGVDAKLLDDFHRQIHRFARSLLEVQCAEPGARGFAGRSAMEQMNRAAHTANSRQADTAMRRTFRRSMKRLARDCHRPSLRLWSW